ncbi:uncharacterized protein BDZ99DRAFT_288057 [Mytilinidion resinicola]|uniref:Heterokaryon incompatibility domain-containing protein n=1 Tax=Mytilinidion resinicola TaxID=574789 RepID=A0A6A6YQD2_9PEZI|nr:uncharacterized protein BDZ99DRAFT_288057 [Mytilinidion resinicola]KAF2810738.1 hypothetical protein BDZ99DRAFT_288057 [Mytilinidion resinicola]
MAELSWDTPYLHGIGKEEETLFDSVIHDPHATMTIYLGDSKIDYPPDKFLQACWTTGLETPCSICNGDFNIAIAPPVRLLSLAGDFQATDPLTRVLPPLTITNYHLKCLKSSCLRYFPVSHAWHQSIAKAYALRVSSPSAAQACYEVPIRTLLAVIQRFGSDVHLWHDYISIPQWQDEFRGTAILPQIFDIFKESGCAIMHVGLHPPVEMMETPTFETLIENESGLKHFFNAHWFSRMWPMIEFDRAGEAYIMSSKYEIMPCKFSSFVKGIMQIYGTNHPRRPRSALKWIEELPLFVRERQKNKCLGYVFEMISDRGCRSFRDKFIGASELLEVPGYPTLLPSISKDACLWISERRLECSDYSPLLLRPSIELKYGKARWLKGHTSMTTNMWGLGVQTQPARVAPRLQDHAIQLELELAGNIADMFSWEWRAEDKRAGFSEVLPYLIKLAGGSAAGFIESLECIYPSQFFWTESTDNSYQFPALQYQVPPPKMVHSTLENHLERYIDAVSRNDITELTLLCDAIISLLGLSTSPPISNSGPFADIRRLQLYSRLCDSSECTFIFVSCPSCDKRSAFRATTWQNPTTQAQLFFIPGLAYQYSVPNGMGIIVENEEILGRVRFGVPACNCNHSAAVKLS